MVAVSFEFFPSDSDESHQKLLDVANELATLSPTFVSVTYGAGGTSQERTLRTVAALTESLSVPVAGHLTTVGASKAQTHQVIDAYRALGVEHVVALRGDSSAEPSSGPVDGSAAPGYETAAELVAAIRARPDGAGFEISVAAYPEVHPMATSARADLDNLKRKLEAGADRAITQFFFDPETFLRFRDQTEAARVEAPIVPGIMPITNFTGIQRFSKRCGTTVPSWLSQLFDGLDDDPEVRRLVAATVVAEQCQRLVAEGVDEFHFYTMNRRHLTTATCHALNRPTMVGAGRPTVGSSSL